MFPTLTASPTPLQTDRQHPAGCAPSPPQEPLLPGLRAELLSLGVSGAVGGSGSVGGSRSIRGLTAGPCCPLLGGLGSAATSVGPTAPASGCGQVRAWPGMGVICPHCWPEATGEWGKEL